MRTSGNIRSPLSGGGSPDDPDRYAALGARLWEAARAVRPLDPVREVLGDDPAAAYAVQGHLNQHRRALGARPVGHKVGLTSPAVQRQLGVDEPDFGVLYDDMDRSGDRLVDLGSLIAPKVEAEVAFVLGADLDGPLDPDTVRAALDHAVPALEIVDSRIRDWDISLTDTVADNASSALFVLGDRRTPVGDTDFRAVRMEMYADSRPVSTGRGSDCLGDPLAAVRWLAATHQRLGSALRRGDVVLSGALGPMVPVTAPGTYRARVSGLGEVDVRFEGGEAR
ncbi:fumarylacetoacetate hydrolase family protein [Streptomyces sp. NPDC005438]|uniref:2-keto-4-pentenoate hydratase n=1 Tax=Streptomyces sp. NPDC005438 TaxID=3156880 RepID=UPI0033A2C0F2